MVGIGNPTASPRVGVTGEATIAAMDVAATVGGAVLGAGVGALLPRPIYRLSVPSGSTPADGCTECQASLPAGIRGWLGRGDCPACRTPLTSSAWRYVAAGALVFGLLVWRLPGRSPADILLLAAWLVFAITGTMLAAIDLHIRRLPTTVIMAGAAATGALIITAAVAGDRLGLVRNAGIAAVILGLAHLALALLTPGQLGMGDVRLAALCGLLLGAHGWGTVLLGAVLPWLLSAVVAGALLWTRRVRGDSLIPLGPFLVAGSLLAAAVTDGGG